MKAWFSSARRRRRLTRIGVLLVAAGVLTIVGLEFPGTDRRNDTPLSNEPVQFTPDPKPVRLTPEARKAALKTVKSFVATAVIRRHVDQSWQLVTPAFRQGYTRKQWHTGEIPVSAFPAKELDVAGAQVDYSLKNTVGLHVWLLPKKGSAMRTATFMAELKGFGKGARRYWLVDSFSPLGIDASSPTPAFAGGGGETNHGAPLGAAWLLAPIAILVLILLVPLIVGIREWKRGGSLRLARRRRDDLPELPPMRSSAR